MMRFLGNEHRSQKKVMNNILNILGTVQIDVTEYLILKFRKT